MSSKVGERYEAKCKDARLIVELESIRGRRDHLNPGESHGENWRLSATDLVGVALFTNADRAQSKSMAIKALTKIASEKPELGMPVKPRFHRVLEMRTPEVSEHFRDVVTTKVYEVVAVEMSLNPLVHLSEFGTEEKLDLSWRDMRVRYERISM